MLKIKMKKRNARKSRGRVLIPVGACMPDQIDHINSRYLLCRISKTVFRRKGSQPSDEPHKRHSFHQTILREPPSLIIAVYNRFTLSVTIRFSPFVKIAINKRQSLSINAHRYQSLLLSSEFVFFPHSPLYVKDKLLIATAHVLDVL